MMTVVGKGTMHRLAGAVRARSSRFGWAPSRRPRTYGRGCSADGSLSTSRTGIHRESACGPAGAVGGARALPLLYVVHGARGADESETDLAKKRQNPVGDLITLTLMAPSPISRFPCAQSEVLAMFPAVQGEGAHRTRNTRL